MMQRGNAVACALALVVATITLASTSAPGDLVGAVDLTATNKKSPGFPTGARVWRILYVSTGVDEHDLQLVCGLVAAPSSGPKDFGGSGRMITRAHGTIGLAQRCLPSSNPAEFFWAKFPGGMGAVAWGSLLGKHEGNADDGMLQFAMDHGWVVAAADYQPDDTYVVGKIAAADVLDSARAASQLMTKEFSSTPVSKYELLNFGHSQGGHAALWAGQLAESYLSETQPSQPTADFTLVGVALEAPASSFTVDPARQPGVTPGHGLADWEMHQTLTPVGIPLAPFEVQIGPALFSYIFGSWGELSRTGTPTPGALFPAYPAAAAPLDIAAIATREGAATIKAVQPLCLAGADGKAIKKAVAPYRNAAAHRMLVPEIWNLPAQYRAGQYFHGGLDQTCATTTSPGVVQWCEWVRWNMPGPLGVHPFPKAPLTAGQPVPLLIAQGGDDTIIHCVGGDGGKASVVPEADDCMSRALF
ncbi:MAG: lipase family protein, partial [Acidimicrobiia bacterium]|nr:lipase family protein [Acidimicrobiia bacterium]